MPDVSLTCQAACVRRGLPMLFACLALLAALVLAPASPALAATITVNTTSDTTSVDGGASLREAIQSINAGADFNADVTAARSGAAYGTNDRIEFSIAGGGVETIAATGAYPPLAKPLTIDGYTQPGASANTLATGSDAVLRIQVDGSLTVDSPGLIVVSPGVTIQGLSLTGFRRLISSFGYAIEVNGATAHATIVGNAIGITPAGVAAPNFNGVAVRNGATATIGGTTPASRNVISGNADSGVAILSTGSGTQVTGNYVGTNPAGDTAVPNLNGIVVTDTPSVTVGGTTAAARNVVSGNTETGISIKGAGSTNATVQGNYVGLNAAGTGGLGNEAFGIQFLNVTGGTIGGTVAGAGNVVSGQSPSGIGIIVDTGSSGTLVQGNLVGTNAAGDAAVPNYYGIYVQNAANVTVGGTTSAARNVASGNLVFGIVVVGVPSTNATVQGNYVGLNAAGTAAIGNGFAGIHFDAPDGLIGGTTAGAGNVVSGQTTSAGYGIYLLPNATETVIQGNLIGTNPAGDAAIPNIDGIFVEDTPNVTVGGTASGARNVASGNTNSGMTYFGPGSTGALVQGNYVGLNAAGTVALGNQNFGVHFNGVTGGVIGGTVPGAGNVVSGQSTNAGYGIFVQNDSTGTVIQGNLVGTNPAGDAAIPNIRGINLLNASNVTVGGTVSGARNVVSGNTARGIAVNDAGSTGALVQGNYVGLNAAGTAAIPNANGIFVSISPNVTVGGTASGARNVVSGNTNNGITYSGAGSTGALVQGNYVGLSAAGTAAIGNGFIGIDFDAVPGGVIGGTVAGAGNVISGQSTNFGYGIYILNGSSGTVIQGNLIGTNAAGDAAIPNIRGIYVLNSSTVTVGGTASGARNVVSGNDFMGIFVEGAGSTGALMQGNYVGLNAAGTAAIGNRNGIQVMNAPNVTVGGSTSGARNVVSGSVGNGISYFGAGSTGALVQGNYVGLNAAGTAAIGNRAIGINFEEVPGGVIGGTVAGAGNVVSGQSSSLGLGYGIAIVTGSGSTVQGNLVGTDPTGTVAIPNKIGIQVLSAPSVTVGGTSAGARNVVSGNTTAGIMVFGPTSTTAKLLGNVVGLNAAGSAGLPNGIGVHVLDAPGVQVGGTAAGEPNVSAFNTGPGVRIEGAAAGASIRANSIYANGGAGIDLGTDGVTANDPGDGDTGPNTLQNFPVLASVSVVGGATRASGTLDSSANAAFTVDFYASDACDPSGNGEGKTYLGSGTVNTGAGGSGGFNVTNLPVVSAGQVVTATVTDSANNTSEFSACRALSGPGVAVVESGGTTRVTEGGATDTFTVALATAPTSPVTITLTFDTAQLGVSPSTLTFAADATALTPQTVTVTALDDTVAEGTQSRQVTLAAASSDAVYNGGAVAIAPVIVTITDNDTSGIVVAPTSGLVTTEAGGTASFTVRLATVPTGSVTIPVTSSNAAEGTASPSSLTFTPANALTAQTVTVTGRDDQVTDGDVAYTIVLGAATSTDPNYGGQDPPDVAVTNRDDDRSGTLGFTTTAVSVPESVGSVTLTVQRGAGATGPAPTAASARPASLAPVTVSYATANGTALAGQDYTAVSGTLSFGADETTKSIVVPILPDDRLEPAETFTVTLSAPPGGATLDAISTVTITIEDATPPLKPQVDNTDKPRKETEDERRQRENTNRGNRDDIYTEGNVVEVHQDEQPPYVVIGNKDGLVKVVLLCGDQCPTIRVGDYLEADGEKQHEALFEATDVSVKRGR